MDNVFLRGYQAARNAGLSDEKIVKDLERNPVYGPMIQQAKGAGLSVGAIMSGLKSGELKGMANPQLDERTRLEGVGRGAEDVFSGVTSLLPGPMGDEYTAASEARANVYDKANRNIGFDGARMGGQALALSPLLLAGPAATATTGKRFAGNAALGGVGGFIPRDTTANRLVNAGVGAVLGGTLPEVMRGGIGQASKLARGAKAKFTNVAPAVEAATRAAGISAASAADDPAVNAIAGTAADVIDDPVAKTREYLAQLAAQQLRATGKIDQAALNRAAKIKAVSPDLNPTLGQITRNPAIYSAERNLRGSGTDSGDLIAARLQEQDAVLRGASKKMVDGTGGEPLTDYAYGGKAGKVLRDKWKAMQAGVSDAYKAVEQQFGDVPVQVDDLVTSIASRAYTEGQETAGGRMANIAMNRLRTYGLFDESGNIKQGASLSIQQLRDLRQTLNSIDSLTGATPDQSIQAKMGVINAIDDAVGNSSVGDVFKPARDAARARFGEFADRTMNRIRTSQVPDEKLFDMATGRNVDTAIDYANALKTGTPDQLAAGEQVIKDTQRKLLAQVLGKAQRGPEGEEGFYPASLRNALNPDLNGYQPEVLDALLTPQQASELRNFSQVLDYLRAEPAHNSINQSNSGNLLAGLMQGGESALVRRLGGGSDLGGGIAGAAVKMIVGGGKEAQQEAMAKALLSGNPAAIPGVDGAALNALLTPDTLKQRLLIDFLTRSPVAGGATVMSGNQ